MNILLLSVFYHPHQGGAEKYAQELIEHLTIKHPDIRFDVLCYNTNKSLREETINGVRIYRVHCFNLFNQQFYLPNVIDLVQTLLRIRRNQYKYVIAQTRFFDVAWWGWLYAKIIRAKSIFIEHGTGFVIHQNRIAQTFSRIIDQTVARFSVHRYSKVVVISKATENFVRNSLKISSPIMIYGGINTRIFTRHPLAQRIIPHLNKIIDSNQKVITYIGRLIDAKGIWILLDSFQKIAECYPVTLLVGGTGYQYEIFKSEIKKRHLENRIFLLGELSYPDEVYQLLNQSDIFVNPSFNEGLPRTVLEACAMENFVIATNVGSTDEIIKSGDTGLLIQPQSEEALTTALKSVLDKKINIDEIRHRSSEFIRSTFDWNLIVDNFYNLITNE